MIYFLNSNSTTTLVKSEPVYQGSINANKLIVFAPFASSSQVSATFTLPNGLNIQGGLMTLLVGSQGLFDKQGNQYNAWSLDLEDPVTQYPGTVRVQFSIALGYGVNPKSYSTQFVVEKGVPSDLPDYTVNDNALEIFNDIKDYLATIVQDTQEAIDNAIAYVRYRSNGTYLLNSPNSNSKIYVVNGSDITESNEENQSYIQSITNGDVSVASMTEYLQDPQIRNPNNSPFNDTNFFQYNTGSSSPSSPAGFIIDLGEEKEIGYIQLYLFAIQWDINIVISANNELEGVYTTLGSVSLKPITTSAGPNPNEMEILRINGQGDNYRFIKVVQTSGATNGSYVCKGIEIYQSNNSGYYEIIQNNGNSFILDTINGRELVQTIENYTKEAQKWANGEGAATGDEQFNNNSKYWSNEAEYWAGIVEQYGKLANKVGGFPVLIAGSDGNPVIPSVFINQVDIKSYIEISNESQLNTIEAQPGDVAVLVETIDGKKTITESWLLLGESNGVRDWAIYGISYATNAGNATFAQSAYNAQRINGLSIEKMPESVYENFPDKSGIYFVLMGE